MLGHARQIGQALKAQHDKVLSRDSFTDIARLPKEKHNTHLLRKQRALGTLERCAGEVQVKDFRLHITII